MPYKTNPPNILIFMTDQQRGDSIFHPAIPTPHIDRFCREGIAFTETFSPSPHCCPSRASFFTGLYPSRHGVWNNVNVANALSRTTKEEVGFFSDLLRQAGYRLDFSGKWHVSSLFGPEDIGWNTGDSQKFPQSSRSSLTREDLEAEKYHNWQKYRKSVCVGEAHTHGELSPGELLRPGYPGFTQYGIDENPFNDIGVTDEAVCTILSRSGTDKPWLQYVGLLGPHDPYNVPQQYLDLIDPESIEIPTSFYDAMKDKPAFYRRTQDIYKKLPLLEQHHKEALRHYYAFCAFIDAQFGRILQALDESGETADTLVLFVSDHGDYAAEHGLWTKGLAGFRGAYHIPAVVRWPGGVIHPGRQIDELVSLVDFAPTFLEVADCAKLTPHRKINTEAGKENIPLAGQSLLPFLQDREVCWRKELYTQSNGNELYGIQRIVFDKKYKFIFNGFDYDELYDLQRDPQEMNNLIANGDLDKYTSVVKEYYKKMWRFAQKNGDQYNNPYINIRFPSFGPGIIFAEDG